MDENGKVKPFVFTAQKNGIVFDVGHGAGAFAFSQAVPALKQGFVPNSISTDFNNGSKNGAMKDLLNVMSKFMAMGMDLQTVIKLTTMAPAKEIQREEIIRRKCKVQRTEVDSFFTCNARSIVDSRNSYGSY